MNAQFRVLEVNYYNTKILPNLFITANNQIRQMEVILIASNMLRELLNEKCFTFQYKKL